MIVCKICGGTFSVCKQYLQHCRVHSNLPKIRLPCYVSSCWKSSSSITGLKMHISRDHGQRKSRHFTINTGSEPLQCTVTSCSVHCLDEPSLIKHLRQHIKDGMKIACPIKGCHRQYDIVSSFSCHMSRDHINWNIYDVKALETVERQHPVELEQHVGNIEHAQVCNEDSDGENDGEHVLSGPSTVNEPDFVRNLALFFARLSTRNLIPDSTVDIIAHELQSICSMNLAYISTKVRSALTGANASDEVVACAVAAIDKSDLVRQYLDTGGALCSALRRRSFMKQEFTLVNPIPVYVGKSKSNKNRYAHYVPIHESLAALLQDESIVQQCHSQTCSGSILRDFTDGTVHRQMIAGAGEHCLSLILYQDSFEVVNPLGSARKKHKLLGVYFVLGNLACHNRSAVDSMQLVLLARECDFDSLGQSMFRQLVADLRTLETDGVTVKGHKYKAVLSAIAGDNLGSHCIGGFTKNFSSSAHICRFCLLTRSDLDTGVIIASHDQMRTPESYNTAVASLQNSGVDCVDGIKFDSVFNQLQFFHVCQPGLPPCTAHDLFEGVVAYDVPLFLQYFVRQKYITVDCLNARVETIGLSGADAKVRPPALRKQLDRLIGSASQNWFFLRIVPVLIQGSVVVSDEVYQTLLLLCELVEYVMAPALSFGQVAYMDVIIRDYLERRMSLFPNVRVRPKHHYMSHYAALTMKFGPLIRLWTMRFESKHQFFKRCIRNSRNFVNVTGMLASRHQMLQAYLSANHRFALNAAENHSVVNVSVSHVSHEILDCIQSAGLNDAQLYKEVLIKGTLYSRGCVLPMQLGLGNRVMIFGQIELIAVSSSVNIIVSEQPAQFDFDTNSYIIETESDSRKLSCVPVDDFVDFYPLAVYNLRGQRVVVLKHQPLEQEHGSCQRKNYLHN